jgi:hypothetical protein
MMSAAAVGGGRGGADEAEADEADVPEAEAVDEAGEEREAGEAGFLGPGEFMAAGVGRVGSNGWTWERRLFALHLPSVVH